MSQAETATPSPQAATVPHPPLPAKQAVAYMGASIILALTQGLGQGFISSNLPQVAGDLGITSTQAAWLLVAYTIPRAALPVMLIKIRTQFGLRRFAEVGIVLYVIVAFASIWINDLRSATILQFLSGCAAAPLSTLAFLYMLEPLAPAWKMRLGLPLAMLVITGGPTLARVVSPPLLGDGGLTGLHLTALGMAMASLMLVYRLPLRPVPHMKVIQPLDFLSVALLGVGFSGIIAASVMGPIHNWLDAPWIGVMLAVAIGSLALAVAIELIRRAPLLDIRWLVSPAILHLTATLLLFRLILSEQAAGAPRMFQVLGLAPSQMTGLFTLILLASLMGVLACIAWITPARVPVFHLVALLLIAFGAWLDSHSGPLTRPAQMFVSQSLIGAASMLFLPSAMMAGLIQALAKGPQYLLSFVIVFITTQSLGGVAGSGLFTTFINHRETMHLSQLTDGLAAADPMVQANLGARAAALGTQITDAGLRAASAGSALAQDAATQAYLLAYDDAYRIICYVALVAAAMLTLHLLRDRLALHLAAVPPDLSSGVLSRTAPIAKGSS